MQMKNISVAIALSGLFLMGCSSDKKNDNQFPENELSTLIQRKICNNSSGSKIVNDSVNKEIVITNELNEIYSIPVNNKESIKGDFNNDNIQDIIIPVDHAVSMSYGVTDYYFFIGSGIENNYFVDSINSGTFSSSTGYCSNGDGRGQFRAKKITNNTLIGESNCYNNGDPNCCPSLHYKTALKYDAKTNTFKLKEQTAIKKN
jgi:hypothetical protein